jgi:cobalamin synthase
MSLTVAAFPAARSEGLGWLVKKGAARTDLLLAGGLAVLVCWLSFHLAGILLFAGVTTLVWLVGRALVNRLTGLTGDAYGALDEIGEVAALALAPLCVTAVSRSTI